jgi:uncharacterized protein Yka (UPF0111/DUF47 family)
MDLASIFVTAVVGATFAVLAYLLQRSVFKKLDALEAKIDDLENHLNAHIIEDAKTSAVIQSLAPTIEKISDRLDRVIESNH